MRNSWQQRTCILLNAAVLLLSAAPAPGQRADQTKGPVVGVLLKADGAGIVELEAVRGSDRWIKIQPPEKLYLGEALRVGTNSRALVQFSDKETAQFEAGARVLLEPPPGRKRGFTALLGHFYFFHRDKPEDFGIRKGRNWMIVRGTELVLDVAEGEGPMVVSVLEGEVELDNGLGRTNVFTGEAGVFETGRAPRKTAMLPAANLIQWCLYYPAVIDADELSLGEETRAALQESLAAYRQGNLPVALSAYPAGRTPTRAAERIYLAALLLSAGQVSAAEALLEGITSRNMDDGRPAALREALRVLISVVRGEPNTNAISSSTPSASTLLAASYAEQAQSRLPAALARAREAVERSPNFGFSWARVAELEFSSGRIPAAQAALEKSLQLAPRNAQAVALQGFVLAARGQAAKALAHFDQAIALDGALGNAWLGRGLCRIRRGDVVGGRNDLQVAVTLEPNRAVLRSYLGKAFDAAGETKRAFREFELARHWDTNDPTAYLYSALLNQRENRINAGIRDLERSLELNDNRRVYRSEFLLDQDRAVRSSSLAQIYQRAGLADPSAREAARAVSHDYANYSAHLFLAESYDALRDPTRFNLRYETPWFSELLLANLLSPVGGTPLSQQISQQEYSRFFERDRVGLTGDASYRSDGQYRALASQFGALGNTAWALDLDYQHNNGVRPNNELDRLEWYTTLKQQLGPQDSMMFLAKYQDYDSGDNFQYFDPEREARPHYRFQEFQQPIALGGWHHEWSPGIHTLFLGGYLQNEQQFSDQEAPVLLLVTQGTNVFVPGEPPFDVDYQNHFEAGTAELNQIFQSECHTLIVGGRYQWGDFRTENNLAFSGPTNSALPPVKDATTDAFERGTAYLYATVKPVRTLALLGGVAYDHVRYPSTFRNPPVTPGSESRDQVGPKAAVTWTPFRLATVRGAWSRSLGGVTLDQSYRLEPTQLAGFVQTYRTLIPESLSGSVNAPENETAGVALDLNFGHGTYLGLTAERLESRVRRDIGVLQADASVFPPAPAVPVSTPERLDFLEYSAGCALQQLVSEEWSIGVRYAFNRAELQTTLPEVPVAPRANLNSADRTESSDLHRAGLFAVYNHPIGFFARAELDWYWQSNDARVETGAASLEQESTGDEFPQLNLLTGWRFPRQRGDVTLGVLNVTGEDYHLKPLNQYSELPRERVFYARLRFRF